MIDAKGLTFAYGKEPLLDSVDLTATDGKVTALLGPNGSGKTTLLRLLYASLVPQAGVVTLEDRPVSALSPREIARDVGVVVQESPAELPQTVAEMVLLGRSVHHGSFGRMTVQDHRLAADALARVGARHLADRSVSNLSGGEKQRVLIARTLAQQATHLLLDEPTNHLDIRYQHEVLSLVRSLGVTTIVVLHDLNLAARYCDAVVLLDRGDVRAAGTPHEVLTPEHLEPVYGVRVRRIEDDGLVQLLFTLNPRTDPADQPVGAASRGDA